MTDAEVLRAELNGMGLSVSEEAQRRLLVYLRELDRWNNKLNLTALHGRQRVRRLVAEPIWSANYLGLSGVLADVGSGNGSPAIPICLTRDIRTAHLVESRVRRAAFLRHVADKLGLTRLLVHRARLENMPPDAFEAADWITMQAVAPTQRLLESLHRLTAPTTKIVWITSGKTAPVASAVHVKTPGGATEIWVFTLDHS